MQPQSRQSQVRNPPAPRGTRPQLPGLKARVGAAAGFGVLGCPLVTGDWALAETPIPWKKPFLKLPLYFAFGFEKSFFFFLQTTPSPPSVIIQEVSEGWNFFKMLFYNLRSPLFYCCFGKILLPIKTRNIAILGKSNHRVTSHISPE